MIKQLEQQGRMGDKSTQLGIVGFLAAAFKKYPQYVDQWISGEFAKDTDYVIVISLAFAGMQSKIGTRGRWTDNLMESLKDIPDLETLTADSANNQDILWGASFASGDAKYANRIIDFLSGVVASEKFDLSDLMTISQLNNENSPEKIRPLVERYGKQSFFELVVFGSGVWSVASNALQHQFVGEALKERVQREGSSNFGYLLKRRVFQEASRIVSTVPGKNFEVMISGSTDRSIVDRIYADTRNSDMNYMRSFKNIFEKDEPIQFVEIVYHKTPTSSECAYTVTRPDGARFNLGRFDTDARKGIFAGISEIPSEKLRQEGIYFLDGECRADSGEVLSVPWRFFVARR